MANGELSRTAARTPPTLTPEKRRAVELLAEGSTPVEKVAEQLGLERKTLWRWRKEPEFVAALADYEAELDRDALQFAIVRRRERLSAYQDRWERLRRVVTERAAYYAKHYPDVPGGGSGLLVPTLKVVGSGPTAYPVIEHVFDAALSRELRALEEHTAKDAGQWSERSELAAVVQQVAVTERTIMRLPPRELPDDVRDSIEQVLRADGSGDDIEADYREVPPESWAELLIRGEAETGVAATSKEWRYAREADAAGIPPPATIEAGRRRQEED